MYQKSYNSTKTNPFLQINCPMDMDLMEITKTKAIKKYEENNYLLGRIFEIEQSPKKNENNSIKEPTPTTHTNIIKDEKKSKNKNDSYNNNNNKISEGLNIEDFFEDKIDDADYDTEEKIDSAIREFSKIYEDNKWEDKTLLNKLNEIYTNYKKEEDLMEKEKADFEKSTKKYENLIASFDNLKSNIELNDIVELVKLCEKEGFLEEKTKKEFEKFVEEYNSDKIVEDKDIQDYEMKVEEVPISQNEQELPFDSQEKIIRLEI